VFISCQMDNCLIQRDECQPLAHDQAQQVSIRHLLWSIQSPKKGLHNVCHSAEMGR
jgi:hypothetical protein